MIRDLLASITYGIASGFDLARKHKAAIRFYKIALLFQKDEKYIAVAHRCIGRNYFLLNKFNDASHFFNRAFNYFTSNPIDQSMNLDEYIQMLREFRYIPKEKQEEKDMIRRIDSEIIRVKDIKERKERGEKKEQKNEGQTTIK